MSSPEMQSEKSVKEQIQKVKIPYRDTGYFSKLITDYLAKDDFLKECYTFFPGPQGFEKAIEKRKAFTSNRQLLVDVLKEQYGNLKNPAPGIDLLLEENSFTICTGHQLVLATGPLYFIYKIAGAIKTCAKLREQFPAYNFLPVFWMAGEDHDFAEANHFYIGDKKIEWESGQIGAVGRMNTTEIAEVLNELKEIIGIGYNAAKIYNLLENAYLKSNDVASAMRKLLHELFGKQGLIVLDADHPKLKKIFAPYAKREILEQISFSAINRMGVKLSERYNLQINPREINLFYLGDQLRERIVARDGDFEVLNSNIKFTQAEILDELEKHPENFSPNVAMRPLYQEIVLPNLAYIGGGGELAYWFQLKYMFDDFELPFPILMLRNSLLYLEKKYTDKLNSLNLKPRDLFRPHSELETELIKRESNLTLNLDEEQEMLSRAFSAIEEKLSAIDPNLSRSVESGLARSSRIVGKLEKKMLKAEKKQQESMLLRLQAVRDYLFPKGGLQERRDNLLLLYLIYGDRTIDIIIENIDPFDFTLTMLLES